MSEGHKRKERKRTIQDKIISGFNNFRYGLLEPIKLKRARSKYEPLYEKPEKNPLVSIYIPTYNRAELLRDRGINSVLKQTYKNFELIIVGDHCTDNTEEVVKQIDDPRIRFVNLPKRDKRYPEGVDIHWFAGPVVPANHALDMIQGKWIARLDDDDIWAPDHLESLLRYAQEGQHEFVSAMHEEERHGEKRIVDVRDQDPPIGGTQTWLYRSYLNLFRYNINCWRKSWNKVNDMDIQDRMHKAGVKMGFLEKVVTYIIPRPGEETVGIDAYLESKKDKLDHFKFKD
jgi:glycosyltransferase involved in cell wall biosynthesis